MLKKMSKFTCAFGFGSTAISSARKLELIGQPLQVELELGQRQAVGLALRRQLADQRAQRVSLMLIGLQDALAGRGEQVGDGGVDLPARPQRQEVDALPDQMVVLQQGLPGGRDSDDDVLRLSQPAHEELEAGEQRDEQGAAPLRARLP